MKKNKLISILLSSVLIISLALSVFPVCAANNIVIDSVGDFEKFAKKCKTDTWSRGKTVTLNSDIDLSKAKLDYVPIFGGVFDGNGHTLSGVNIKRKGSYTGLFRHIESGAAVKNLNVSGNIKPSGSKKYIGGIAGENSGAIINCRFDGNVEGQSYVGGIAGIVTAQGKIQDCTHAGSVYASNYTGGIAGENGGTVVNCENKGDINASGKERTKSVTDIDLDIENLRSTENADSSTDTGGICGYSNGTVKNCTNRGKVGSKSIGYNTGGICGRQAGYIEDCKNYGNICGRKDVGGIAGQAEPYVVLAYTKDALSQLNGVFERIQSILESKAVLSGDEISVSLDKIDSALSDTIDSADVLSADAEKYGDDIAADVNELSKKLNEALNDISAVSDDLSKGTDEISKGISYFEDAGSSLTRAVKRVEKACDMVKAARKETQTAIGLIKGIGKESDLTVKEAIVNAYETLKSAKEELQRAADSLSDAINQLTNSVNNASSAISSANTGLNKINKATEYISSALDKMKNTVEKLSEGGAKEIKMPSETFGKDFDDLIGNLKKMQGEFLGLKTAAEGKKDVLSSQIDSLNGELGMITTILSRTYDEHVKSEKDYTEDISEKETADVRGKIYKSKNSGSVEGDKNCGGIVGMMAIEYDFDPEDDTYKSGEKSLDFVYKARAVVRRCVNNGNISSSGECAGGIAGRMELGSIMSCESYENISGEKYTGGISGLSDGYIHISAFKGQLSGGDYTGGIAGKGKTVKNCFAVVHFEDYGEFTGSIAGDAPKYNLSDNRFVSGGIGGLDDINYTGIAQEGTVEQFVKYARTHFGTDTEFKLTFAADEKIIKELPFKYEEKIPDDMIPPVPEKDGYYGKWEEYDFENPSYDATINALYYRDIQLIESDMKKEGKPAVLVCGAFDDKASVSAEKISLPKKINHLRVNDGCGVKISKVYSDEYTVRYLPSEKSSFVRLYIEENGKIHAVKTKTEGSYLEFKAPEKSFTIYEVRISKIVLLSAVLALVFTSVIALLMIKRKIKK